MNRIIKHALVGVVAAGAISTAVTLTVPLAHADTFLMCSDGHEGVVGDHTSCPFAAVVRSGYFQWGPHFRAHSPVMDEWYEVDCDPYPKPAYFVDGAVVSSIACYAANNAEVVIW